MIEDGTLVMPGDEIAKAEELIAGEGTYEENGVIRSSIIGLFKPDREKLIAMVKPLSDIPLTLHNGDTVLGEVKQVMESMVMVKIIHVAGKKRQIAGEKDAAIYISNISEEFVKNTSEKFKIGDIIRAKIIRTSPAIQLSTKGREYGVIKAYCSTCRHPLIMKNNHLECPVCGRRESRKIADDYGKGNIDRVI
ncbi:MAG: exosome complex RNA-binding protein Csl4 [Thermoplasmata archaeon]|nr:exosome complex RNA-binding protein Csl4 [Thermoplasmata archaeon]